VRVPRLELSTDLLILGWMPWAMLAISAALVLGASRVLKWSRPVTGALLLLVPLGNTSFLGIPMVQAYFGDLGIPYAVLYDQLGTFLAVATYGALILAVYAGAGAPTLPGVLRKIVSFPPFLALVVAFLLRPVSYPDAVVTALEAIAASLVPVIMVAVGLRLELRADRAIRQPLAVGLILKMVVAPLVALLICRALALNSDPARVAVFEAGMPPMITAGVLAIQHDLEPRLSAALVGYGILLSFGTLYVLFRMI
jgi:predicted permease